MLGQKVPEPRGQETRALLACGVLAGPLYIVVTAIQALSRAGFDPRRHRYNQLTIGDLGWIHQINYVVAGVLMVLFAVGVGRLLRRSGSGPWGPRLLALYGLAYISSGVFTADPMNGFPPGTLSQATTWHGALQMASRSLSSLALVAASVVIARSYFIAQGLRNWTWFSFAAVPIPLVAFALLGAAGAETSTKYLAFLVPGISMWVWISALAVHLYRRGERGVHASSGSTPDSHEPALHFAALSRPRST